MIDTTWNISSTSLRHLKKEARQLPTKDGARDFDFEIGNWHVRHRRLELRLQNCHEWEEFSGHCAMQPSLGGYGNLEQNLIEIPGGTYHAIAIRAFDPNSGTWAIRKRSRASRSMNWLTACNPASPS